MLAVPGKLVGSAVGWTGQLLASESRLQHAMRCKGLLHYRSIWSWVGHDGVL